VLLLINLPVMSIYNSYQYYKDDTTSIFARLSLGNMGFAETHCDVDSVATFLEGGSGLRMGCNSGYIKELVAFGIKSSFSSDYRFCNRKDSPHLCNKYINNQKFRDDFQKRCMHKDECVLNDVQEFIMNFSNQVEDFNAFFDVQNRFYVQYKCEQKAHEVENMIRDSTTIAYVQGAILLILFLAIIKNKIDTTNLVKRYDAINISASDYTLYLKISPAFVKDFNRSHQQQMNMTRGQSIKNYIQEKIHIEGLSIVRVDLMYDRNGILTLL
jgi:hypothetical protein